MTARAAVLGLLLAACAPRQGPCTPEADRALVGARYQAELAAACPDHTKPLSQCAGYREVHDRYLKARESWVQCSKN